MRAALPCTFIQPIAEDQIVASDNYNILFLIPWHHALNVLHVLFGIFRYALPAILQRFVDTRPLLGVLLSQCRLKLVIAVSRYPGIVTFNIKVSKVCFRIRIIIIFVINRIHYGGAASLFGYGLLTAFGLLLRRFLRRLLFCGVIRNYPLVHCRVILRYCGFFRLYFRRGFCRCGFFSCACAQAKCHYKSQCCKFFKLHLHVPHLHIIYCTIAAHLCYILFDILL